MTRRDWCGGMGGAVTRQRQQRGENLQKVGVLPTRRMLLIACRPLNLLKLYADKTSAKRVSHPMLMPTTAQLLNIRKRICSTIGEKDQLVSVSAVGTPSDVNEAVLSRSDCIDFASLHDWSVTPLEPL